MARRYTEVMTDEMRREFLELPLEVWQKRQYTLPAVVGRPVLEGNPLDIVRVAAPRVVPLANDVPVRAVRFAGDFDAFAQGLGQWPDEHMLGLHPISSDTVAQIKDGFGWAGAGGPGADPFDLGQTSYAWVRNVGLVKLPDEGVIAGRGFLADGSAVRFNPGD